MESHSLLNKAVEVVFKELNGIILEDDYTEYSAKRKSNDKTTRTKYRIYNGEKLSRLVLERYSISSKASGVVLNIYPEPKFGIPIFTFQLGGQIPERVIFVLDVIPITETETNSALNSLHKKYASEMKNLGCTQNWIKRITSENSLVCQYRPLEPDRIINALTDYLKTWREKLYLPAEPNIGEKREKMAVENILEYKKILHENDTGLDIYRKKFSKPMVKTIEEAAFGSEPSLKIHKNNKHTDNSGKNQKNQKK